MPKSEDLKVELPERSGLRRGIEWLELEDEPVLGFDGVHPRYRREVHELASMAAHRFWRDTNYAKNLPERADEATVAVSGLQAMKALMTLFWRQERFCDGYWAGVIRSGFALAIFRRALELLEEVERGEADIGALSLVVPRRLAREDD